MPHERARSPKKRPAALPPPRLPADVLTALLAASQAVGRGFPERARWLVSFANADLTHATPAAFNAWRWQAIVWSQADPADLGLAFARGASGTSVQPLTWGPLWEPHALADDPAHAVRHLQRHIRACLDGLLTRGSVVVKQAAGEPLLERRPDGTVVRRVAGSALVAFFSAVCDVLVELGSRLRVCDPPACSRYVAAVGHFRYCSPACSQRVRTRRFEEKRARGAASGTRRRPPRVPR